MKSDYTRRDFLRLMGTAAGALALSSCAPVLGGIGPPRRPLPNPGAMPLRSFGPNGEPVSLFGLGGEAAIESTDQALAVEIINEAIDRGVTYFDTSWFYGSGRSEANLGQVMPTRRHEVFLATKSARRDYDGVMTQFEQSLNRLNTDHVDLYQLHDVRTSAHLNNIFSSNGALKAMQRLQEEGAVRFIGITGHHNPEILLQAVNQYPFDAILLSHNAADRWYLPFHDELFTTAVEKNMAVIGMKVFGKGRLVGDGKLTAQQAMSYVYSFPVSCAIMGIWSVDQLIEDITITQEFIPLSAEELETLEVATQPYHEESGNWFKMGLEEV